MVRYRLVERMKVHYSFAKLSYADDTYPWQLYRPLWLNINRRGASKFHSHSHLQATLGPLCFVSERIRIWGGRSEYASAHWRQLHRLNLAAQLPKHTYYHHNRLFVPSSGSSNLALIFLFTVPVFFAVRIRNDIFMICFRKMFIVFWKSVKSVWLNSNVGILARVSLDRDVDSIVKYVCTAFQRKNIIVEILVPGTVSGVKSRYTCLRHSFGTSLIVSGLFPFPMCPPACLCLRFDCQRTNKQVTFATSETREVHRSD